MNMLKKEETVNYITELVLKEILAQGLTLEQNKTKIPVSISARHIHLKKEDLEMLFGSGHELTRVKDISQPGQFAAEEKVTLVGPKGNIENVRVLGPLRKETQIEISITDARTLGIKPVVRDSGNVDGTPGLTIIGPKATLQLEKGCIVAQRHIHMTPKDAVEYGVKDGQKVMVKCLNDRGGIFDNVFVRVREDYALDMHIDTDEANAFSIGNGEIVEILK